jgi:hypothetical protein
MKYSIEEIGKVIDFYANEEEKCRNGGADFAATLMRGAILESLLLIMCLTFKDKVRRTQTYKKMNNKETLGKKKENEIIFDFRLINLVKIAKELSWIRGETEEETKKLISFMDDTKRIRNFIHPALIVKNKNTFIKEGCDNYEKTYKAISITIENCLREIIDLIIDESSGFKMSEMIPKKKLDLMRQSVQKMLKEKIKTAKNKK